MNRLLIAAAVSMMVSLFGTKLLLKWLTEHRIGQPIRSDGPEGHHTKAGTPTMGGVAIVSGAVLGYVISDFFGGIKTVRGIFVLMCIVGGGAVGLLDDWIKVVAARNRGLSKRAKIIGLLVVASGFAFLMTEFTSVETTVAFTRFDHPGWEVGRVGWMVWAVLLIVATTNSVNLTDGLDGLAAGAGLICFAAFTVIAFWQFRHVQYYDNPAALDLSVISAARSEVLSASCGGTRRPRRSSWVMRVLWLSAADSPPWRCRPARTCCCRSSEGCSLWRRSR